MDEKELSVNEPITSVQGIIIPEHLQESLGLNSEFCKSIRQSILSGERGILEDTVINQ